MKSEDQRNLGESSFELFERRSIQSVGKPTVANQASERRRDICGHNGSDAVDDVLFQAFVGQSSRESGEGDFSGKQFPQEGSKSVNIGGLGEAFAGEDFRSGPSGIEIFE